MDPTHQQIGNHCFLYDAEQIDAIASADFEPRNYQDRGLLRAAADTGRGTAYFISFAQQEAVLRHYRRGGMMANVLGDRYPWAGLQRTRAWREWFLLSRMRNLSLPVPKPLAVHVQRQWWYYKADIIIERITNAKPIAEYLESKALRLSEWKVLGATIRKFHHSGVCHADLNAGNVLVGLDKQFHLIDFDRSCIRPRQSSWEKSNINRLHGSLQKLAKANHRFHFSAEDWKQFMAGYTQL